MKEIKIPKFSIIVGNLPFRRQEDVDKDELSKIIKDDFKKHLSSEIEIDGRSDYFIYCFIKLIIFLEDNGRVGLITSNTWLEKEYGISLKRFLLDNFRIIAFLTPETEPWFTSKQNTIIVILEKESDVEIRNDNIVKFIMIKEDMDKIINWENENRYSVLNSIIYEKNE